MSNKDHDIIIVKDLDLMVSIGIYDHEKAAPQRVIANIEIKTSPIAGISSDEDIDQVISYEDIVKKVTDLAGKKHIELVETFASDIADICLESDKALSCTVTVEKPDIISNVKSVGIKIQRTRSS